MINQFVFSYICVYNIYNNNNNNNNKCEREREREREREKFDLTKH